MKKPLGMLEVSLKRLKITCLTACDLKAFLPTFSVGLPSKPKEMWSIAWLQKRSISYRVTTVSHTKHVQRNICHLSNPIKVGWFAREGHLLHSLCDWTFYNWVIANNSGLISVDCIFGGGVGFCSTSDAEGLVQSDRIVAGVCLQQCVKRTIV